MGADKITALAARGWIRSVTEVFSPEDGELAGQPARGAWRAEFGGEGEVSEADESELSTICAMGLGFPGDSGRVARAAHRVDDGRVPARPVGPVHRLVGLAQQLRGIERRDGRQAIVMPIETVTTARQPSRRKLPSSAPGAERASRRRRSQPLLSRCPAVSERTPSPPILARMSVLAQHLAQTRRPMRWKQRVARGVAERVVDPT